MGSGLILLVIVGAWLAVLVPIALRSSESSSTASTVDAFHDAMRVLSRRDPVLRSPDSLPGAPVPVRLTVAARRRRVLAVLVGAAAATLVGALLGPVQLLGLHLAVDALLLAYVGHLRHTAVLRRERARRARRVEHRSEQRLARRRADGLEPVTPAVPHRAPSRVAGVPDRIPSRAVVLGAPDPTAVTPVGDLVLAPARGAQGRVWDPVPVPLPAYLTAPVAPRERVVPAAREEPREELGEHEQHRRAVND